VAFEAAPKICELAKQKEAELDSRLENKIKGLFQCPRRCICNSVISYCSYTLLQIATYKTNRIAPWLHIVDCRNIFSRIINVCSLV